MLHAETNGAISAPVPEGRIEPARAVARSLVSGTRVALVTHVNADGDGAGSEVALWHLLTDRGVRAVIANPTPFPTRFAFLLDGIEQADKSNAAARYIKNADVILVVDISDLDRLGNLGQIVAEAGVFVACIDHHLSDGSFLDGSRLVDSTACATGELVYDLATACNWGIRAEAAQALYVAILTDTGGFRFSNTTPRALHVAAALSSRGIDPEGVYHQVYASNPEGRIRLIGDVVDTLVVEPDSGLAWVTVPAGALERHGVNADQLDGIVEYPRSIAGVRLALLFRRLANGRVKVSFRSMGDVNVAKLAETFGGGGHRRAAGALLEGSLAEVQEEVLRAARESLR